MEEKEKISWERYYEVMEHIKFLKYKMGLDVSSVEDSFEEQYDISEYKNQ